MPARKVAGALVLAVLATSGCEDFLQVQDPGRYTDDALNTPLALTAVANGVEGDFTSNAAGMAWDFGQMSDELMHTGTWNPDADLDKGNTPTLVSQGAGQYQGGWLADRLAAQKAQERFATVMGDTASRSELMARVVAIEGWANLFMGMYNCESPSEPNGEIVSDMEMFQLAIPLLTEAASIAGSAGATDYQRFAIAGRARANLYLGNLDAALSDAQSIPDDYVFWAHYSAAASAPSNTLVNFAHRSELKAAGLDQRRWSMIDTIAGRLIDPWTGELDNRVKVSHQPNERGADGVTQFYNQDKYVERGDDVAMTHGMEMRLIEAEVHMRKNNLVAAMERINYVRNQAGLDPVTATTAADVQEKLLHERFAQMFLEAHRMVDLHRFGLVDEVLGTGRPTKFPLTSGEIQLNQHVNGQLQGRCLPTS
jgi:hypothetical protein